MNLPTSLASTLTAIALLAACHGKGDTADAGVPDSAAAAASAPALDAGDPAAASAATPAATTQPAVAAAVAALPPPKTFKFETNKAANMKFEVPTDWTISTNGAVLTAKSPTPGVGLEFAAAANAEEAKKEEAGELVGLSRVVQGAKITSKTPVAQHGLKGLRYVGNGTINGKPVEFLNAVLSDGKGHFLSALGFYAAGANQFKDAYVRILDSIQPAS